MAINSQTFLLLIKFVIQLLFRIKKIQSKILNLQTNIMRGKGVNVLDTQYSQSAQKIRSILEQSSVGESKMSEMTLSRNQNSVMIKQYLNIARRLHYLFKEKERTYSSVFISRISLLTKTTKINQKRSLRQVTLICNESILRYKTLAFNKLFANRLTTKTNQQRKFAGVKMMVSMLRSKQRNTMLLYLMRLRIKIQNANVIISKPQMQRTSKVQKQTNNQEKEKDEQLSLNLITPLKQLVTYDKATFVNLTLNRLQSPLEIEVKKISNTRDLRGTPLLLMVLNNHIKAIVDLNNLTQINGSIYGGGGSSSRRSFNQKNNNVAIYEELGNQFFQSDQQLNKLIVLSNDIPKALGAIELAIKNYTSRNYRHKNNKIIQSRVKLLELILSILRSTITQSQVSNTQVPPLLELKNQGTSFKQLQVSHVRLIVEELDHKVYELSTISEQIPQLQTFKRTLDLTMPQHNSYLTKIVDVLIQLHHKVNKLISRRPEKLLRQIQAVQQQCLIIQIASSQFLQKLQSETQIRLKPIYFDQRNNKSPDYFRKIQKNVVKLSQVIIECMDLQQQARQKIIQIKSLIQVFWNLVAGMEECQKQWKSYKNRQNKTNDQQQIIQMLQLCLKFVNDRIDKMNEDFQIQRQTLIDGNNKNIEFMDEQLNKLSRENQQQRAIIAELQKQNEQFRDSLKDYELKYKDLLRKTQYDASDYQMRINALQKRQKNYKDKIESLESENEQKKVMITNITNDLKRAMKQTETTWKADQKNKDLEQIIQKLNIKIEDLQSQIKNYRQDNDVLKQQKIQLQRNNDLVMKKLDDANRRIGQLQNQLADINYRNERERSRLKQDIDQLERLNKKLNQQINTSHDSKVREHDKKQIEYKSTVAKKDEKITQLSDKISDLNSKLNQMLNNYKNMEFELKRKQRNQQDLSSRLKQVEGKNNNDYKDLLVNYEKNQIQLNNALAEIERCRNRTVPDLEKQIRKRQAIIAEMQKIINELDQKQSAILDQQQNNLNLRKLIDELEDKVRQKDLLLFSKQKQMENALRDKDSRIKQLEYNSNINNSKLNQFESQLRIDNDDKNRKIRQLESKIRQLQSKLGNAERDGSRVRQLQSKLASHQRQANRIRQLQSKLVNAQREANRARQLQGKLNNLEREYKNAKEEINRFELKSRTDDDQKNRKIRQLENKIRQLESRLSNAQRDTIKLRQLQNSLNNAQRQNRNAKDSERENQRLRQANEKKIRDLQSQLNSLRGNSQTNEKKARDLQNQSKLNQNKIKDLQNQLNSLRGNSDRIKQLENALQESKNRLDRMNDLQNQLRNAKSNLNRIGLLESQLRSAKDQLSRLRQSEAGNAELTNKIMSLQASLFDRNRVINELEAKIRNLENQLRSQQSQLSRTKGLVDDLLNKQRQLALLQQEKASYQASKVSQDKINEYIKQIQYLKEKVRSLEDLIDIFTEEHGILQAKIKQYRLREGSSNSKDGGQKYDKLNLQYNRITSLLRSREDQIDSLKRKIEQSKIIYNSPISKANLIEQAALKQKIQKLEKQVRQLNIILQRYENQIRSLKDQVSSYQTKYNDESKFWVQRQRSLVQQNHILKTELGSLQIKLKTIQGSGEGDKYYLRVQGQRLEQLIKRMESGSWNLNTKLDQILSNSRKIEQTSQISSNSDFQKILLQNKTLMEEIRIVMNEKSELSTIVQNYPNPDFLTEYAFRIIIYFSQIHPESPQGKCIWEELQRIRRQNSGEQYFIILQQFTKFTLQENAIQVYRRQLRDKAQELQMLKAKLDIFFQQQLISQKRTYEKTALTESRVAMFRQKLTSSSHSSFTIK